MDAAQTLKALASQRLGHLISISDNLESARAHYTNVRQHMKLRAYVCLAFTLVGCSEQPKEATLDSDIAASIEAFKNRKTYSELNPTILDSIDDVSIEQAVVDYVFAKLDDEYDREAEILAELSPGMRSLYLTWIVEAEVNNGGFNQYYYNTEGKFAQEAVEAFEYFGATLHAGLMQEANVVWSEEKVEMAKFRDAGTLEAFSESYEHTKLGPLDDRFFQLGEDLSSIRIARIRQTPEQFIGK